MNLACLDNESMDMKKIQQIRIHGEILPKINADVCAQSTMPLNNYLMPVLRIGRSGVSIYHQLISSSLSSVVRLHRVINLSLITSSYHQCYGKSVK